MNICDNNTEFQVFGSMNSDDKIEYLVNKITELKSTTQESCRKESFMERALEKLEENKQEMISDIRNLKI